MPANLAISENDLLEAAIAWLGDRLPASWEVGKTNRQNISGTGPLDLAIDLKGDNRYVTVAVEAKNNFSPRSVNLLLGSLGRTLRSLAGNAPILVVAPWLSTRTQELLRGEGINYLDLTGNSWFRLDGPTLYIETQGARRDPTPAPRGRATFNGPKAGRLVRTLIDIRPPYGVRELALAIGLTQGYVSRLLDTLEDEALVRRSTNRGVESADILGLIRLWAGTYDVFAANKTTTFIAPAGPTRTLERLADSQQRTAVTGSFAAVRLAPVAGPSLLALYCDDPATIASEFDLIPADRGSNVAILDPFDPVVWERTSGENGVTFAAPSQVAIDCLTGNGRMPAEGEALVQWLVENEDIWRLPRLPAAHWKESP